MGWVRYPGGTVADGREVILLRNNYEFEPQWLTLLQQIHRMRIIPIGLMSPRVNDRDDHADDDEFWVKIKNWLDGSEVTLSQDHLSELAHGLEVLRKASGSRGSGSVVELPGGFEERVSGQGMVWRRVGAPVEDTES
ncbi:hypothetical protein ACS0TY_010287 [Phlomoides rotata]